MRKIDSNKLAFLISEHTRKELSENRIGCKEILVHQEGECVYRGVFGTKSVGGDKAEPGMLYRAASMTKPVTAVAILQLADKGLLSLDDTVSRFFPKAKTMKVAVTEGGEIRSLLPLQKEITVENLLSHTSGVGCAPLCDMFKSNNDLPFEMAVDGILEKPLSFEPDAMQCYGTTEAFDIAAAIAETVSGQPFDEYLEENLFSPLGMKNTTFRPTAAQWENTVTMHRRTADGESRNEVMPTGCVFENFTVDRRPAGAGLVTTAQDYIKLADMLCRGGKTVGNRQILSEQAVRRMATPHVPANFENWCEKWGLGVRIVVSDGYPHGLGVGCFGWSGAYGTHFWVDRENRVSVVMMKNSRFDGGAGNQSACQLETDVFDSFQ